MSIRLKRDADHLKRDCGARGARAAAKGKPPARLLASVALLVLVFSAVALPPSRGRTPAAPRDARAALLNPRHKFWGRRAPDVFRVRFETGKGAFVVEAHRSEERRVGKECRARWWPKH